MLLELSDLQRADMQRRQKVVAKIPVSNNFCCQTTSHSEDVILKCSSAGNIFQVRGYLPVIFY